MQHVLTQTSDIFYYKMTKIKLITKDTQQPTRKTYKLNLLPKNSLFSAALSAWG